MKYFDLDELVCPHVYNVFGEMALSFLDPRLLETVLILREHIDKSIYVNNWKSGGEFSQRGFRCIQCQLVKDAIKQNRLYVSEHMCGQSFDMDIVGYTAEEARQWIIDHQYIFPYHIRLEQGVKWVHLGMRGGKEKITMFNG
jgi:hypothetical protein